MKRRALLATVGSGMATLSGCSAIGIGEGSDEKIRIDALHVASTHDEPHTTTVVIEDGGSVIFERQFRTEAVSHESGSPETVDVMPADLGNWHEEAGDYQITATLDSGPEESLDAPAIHNSDCIKLRVRIVDTGGLAILTSTCD